MVLSLQGLQIPTEAVLQTAAVSPDIYDFNTFDSDGDGEWTLAEGTASKSRALAIQQFEYADKNLGCKAKILRNQDRQSMVYLKVSLLQLDQDGDGLHSFEEIDQDIAYMDYQRI